MPAIQTGLILTSLHTIQAALGVYGLYVSYISITNLRQYEETTKKAAKYSDTAAEQLHKTRTTQAAGAITILLSTASSLTLATAPTILPSLLRYSLSPALLLGTIFARAHISDFWAAKAKVPFVQGYNEAISRTAEMLRVLAYLEGSWVVMSLLGPVMGY
ncbi:hypothetical protein LTR66_004137 [Elasticomyces elasticus]|nr:hypothetical protein LTR66_004137 [Elasticomyces elasticus]